MANPEAEAALARLRAECVPQHPDRAYTNPLPIEVLRAALAGMGAAAEGARAEARESAAQAAELEAERIKHTSHVGGPGMGDEAAERACLRVAAEIRASVAFPGVSASPMTAGLNLKALALVQYADVEWMVDAIRRAAIQFQCFWCAHSGEDNADPQAHYEDCEWRDALALSAITPPPAAESSLKCCGYWHPLLGPCVKSEPHQHGPDGVLLAAETPPTPCPTCGGTKVVGTGQWSGGVKDLGDFRPLKSLERPCPACQGSAGAGGEGPRS